MEDFLPNLWESAKGAAASELALIGRRILVAMGKKSVDAMGQLLQRRRQPAADEASTNEINESPLLTIEQDTVEQQVSNLLSVLEKLKEDVEESPRDPDSSEIPDRELDPDWFNSWRQGASNVSNDEIHKWWA